MGPIERLKQNVIDSILVGNRPIIWGVAGCGKTSLINSIGRELGRMVVTIIPSLCDPTDINGFPIPNRENRVGRGGESRTYPVIEFAPRRAFIELNSHSGGGILFFDELTGGSQSIQSALLRTMIDGVAGDFEFHNDIAIVAAANPPDEAVNGQELGGPMVNRLVHYQYPSHVGTGTNRTVNPAVVDEWCVNFVGWWGNPTGDWTTSRTGTGVEVDHMIRARSLVSEFIRKRPNLWHAPNPDVSTQGWPSPRSWARASRDITLTLARKAPLATCLDRIAGSVGAPAAIELLTYAEKADLPDPEAVLADPLGWKFSGRSDVDYAVMIAVVAAVQGNPTAARVIAALEVAGRSADRTNGPVREAAMVAIRPLHKIIEGTSQAYKTMTKGMSAFERSTFEKEIARLTKAYGSIADLLK